VVDTGGGLLGHTEAVLEHVGVLVVDERGKVTTVVEDEVEGLAGGEGGELLLQTPVVLLLALSFPREAVYCQIKSFSSQHSWTVIHRSASSGNGSGGVILSGEDVAAGPGEFSTKGPEGLDENGGLDRCVDISSGLTGV